MNNHGFILLSSKIILNKVAFRLPPYLILLLGLEVVLADAANGAYPVIGDVLKRCSCGDAAIGITSTPPMAEIHKTALGAEDSVDWQYYPSALIAVEALKAEGYEILSIEQAHGSTMLQDFIPLPGKKYAVVFGNEVKGVHQEVVDASDGCLEIPQFGTKHSLNVSVTAGIVI